MDKSTAKNQSVKKEDWIDNRWRPAMGWLYFAICACDFILFPIANSVFYYPTSTPLVPWTPLTLGGGGLVHIAFGSIVTMTSWARMKEKMSSNTIPEDK